MRLDRAALAQKRKNHPAVVCWHPTLAVSQPPGTRCSDVGGLARHEYSRGPMGSQDKLNARGFRSEIAGGEWHGRVCLLKPTNAGGCPCPLTDAAGAHRSHEAPQAMTRGEPSAPRHGLDNQSRSTEYRPVGYSSVSRCDRSALSFSRSSVCCPCPRPRPRSWSCSPTSTF